MINMTPVWSNRNDKLASGPQRHLNPHTKVTSGAGSSTAPPLTDQQPFLDALGVPRPCLPFSQLFWNKQLSKPDQFYNFITIQILVSRTILILELYPQPHCPVLPPQAVTLQVKFVFSVLAGPPTSPHLHLYPHRKAQMHTNRRAEGTKGKSGGLASCLTAQHKEQALQSLGLRLFCRTWRWVYRMAEASVVWGEHLQFPSRKVWSSYLESIILCSLISRTVQKLHNQKEMEVVFVLEGKRISFS